MEKISFSPKYDYKDYELWEGNWELISGTAYAMTPLPTFKHQNISQKIAQQLGNLLSDCKKCIPLLPMDWKVSDDTILQPDNCVICYPINDEDRYLTSPPTLIFEILSPSTATKDKILKYHIYQEQKVKYYVIVNPKLNLADVFELKNDEYEKILVAKNETFNFELGDCKIDFDFSFIW